MGAAQVGAVQPPRAGGGMGWGGLALPPGEGRCWHSPREARPCKGSRNLSLTQCQTQSGCSRNCNPIKVRLVYLSSSGLFITVQMAATFGRLSSSLPAARHAKLSSTESGPAPVRGHEQRPPGHPGSSIPLPLGAHTLHPPPTSQSWWPMVQVSAPRSTLHGASSPAGHTWCGAPHSWRRQVLSEGKRK